MTRRIAYALATAALATMVGPAAADRECFDSSCQAMPMVIETPEAQAVTEEPVITEAVPAATAMPPQAAQQRAQGTSPQQTPVQVTKTQPQPAPVQAAQPLPPKAPPIQIPPVRAAAKPLPPERPAPASPVAATVPPPPVPTVPQMIVEPLERPAVKPPAFEPHEPRPRTARAPSRSADPAPTETAEVQRPTGNDALHGFANGLPNGGYTQPSANVIVVTRGYSYGDDGIVMAHRRNDPSFQLCQTKRNFDDETCSPYQYHAYGQYGYRPLGAYRAQRTAPAYVYVPDAKIIAVGE